MGGVMRLVQKFVLLTIGLATGIALGCASDPWRSVRVEDTAASYHRYLNQFPDSRHAAEARERIAFLELLRDPSLEGYQRFQADHPQSELVDALRPQMDASAFEVARFAGTPEAYASYLETFPNGEKGARARGNRAYLEAGGYTSRARDLEEFAAAHPESDYAEDARLSSEALHRRDEESFSRVGLVIRIAPGTGEVQRVADELGRRAMLQYKRAGYRLVNVSELEASGRANEIPRARLVIEHREKPIKSSVSGEDFIRPGMQARTTVSLLAEAGGTPIWQREFKLRLSPEDHRAGTSMLFSPRAEPYWREFFVPVASWPNQASIRPPLTLSQEVVALDSVGDRIVALQANGEFDLIELASTQDSITFAHYDRPKDLTRWSGVRILGSRVLIFGEDGLEIVGFGEQGPFRVARLARPVTGEVYAAERSGDELMLASSRGLLLIDADGGNLRRLLRRPARGLATLGDTVVFSDSEKVYISTLALIGRQKVIKQLKLGHEFGPGRLVAHGDKVIVLGREGVVVLSVADPSKPEVVSRLESSRIGLVSDAALIAGRVFLMGERGLQLLDPGSARVVEVLDIGPSTGMSEMGRFLVTIKGKELQAVDTAPMLAKRLPIRSHSGVSGAASPAAD